LPSWTARKRLIIGADIFYDDNDFDAVFSTVQFLNAPLMTVFQHRGQGLQHLRATARKWKHTLTLLDWPDIPSLQDEIFSSEMQLILLHSTSA